MNTVVWIRSLASWAFQSLLFHRTRSALTVTAVGLSTALLTSTLGFHSGYERSLKRNIDAMGYQVLVTGKGCPHEAATLILRGGSIPMYIREEIYRAIVEQPEVEDSTRFFMQSVPGPHGSSHQLHVGIDENFLRLKPVVEFQRGEWFTSPAADEAILGFNVAEYRRLGIGDKIEVRGHVLAVRGILDKMGTQDDGTIRAFGASLESSSPGELTRFRRDHVGFVFQDFRLIRHLSALDNVRLPLLFSGRGHDGNDARELLEKFRMRDRARRRPNELSRGEMQRVALARALVNRPELLLADEPTANLDRNNSQIIWEHLAGLNRDDGVTVVVATHSAELAQGAGRVIRIDDGKIVSNASHS